jgi:FkbM family methyltransferase
MESTSTSPPPVVPLPNGLKLALQSRQQLGCANFIIKEVFPNRSYCRPGFEISPADTVVDLGANIGVFALWASPQATRVISIEPTRAIECLEKSLVLNGIGNVSVVRCAVSDKPGTIELLEYPGFNAVSHSASFQPARWGQRIIRLLWRKEREEPVRISCPCQTLDDILQSENVDRVDLLKVDCEGGEYALFDSIREDTLARISRIALEFHELHPSHDHRRIVNRLKSAGFGVTVERTLLDRLLQTGKLWAKRTA